MSYCQTKLLQAQHFTACSSPSLMEAIFTNYIRWIWWQIGNHLTKHQLSISKLALQTFKNSPIVCNFDPGGIKTMQWSVKRLIHLHEAEK